MVQARSPADIKSPLQAAQEIVAELQGMPKEDQTLALKFAMETLRLETSGRGTSSKTAVPPQSSPDVKSSTSADIKMFTASKSPQSDQQFTAVVAYYYLFEAPEEDRRESIDPDTMREAARLAGRPQVKRWAMTLTNAKNAGYLDPAGHGKYKLNAVGENLVAITLPGDSTDAAGAPRSRGTKRRKKKAAKKASGKASSSRTSKKKPRG